jgi:hypothetical protein
VTAELRAITERLSMQAAALYVATCEERPYLEILTSLTEISRLIDICERKAKEALR